MCMIPDGKQVCLQSQKEFEISMFFITVLKGTIRSPRILMMDSGSLVESTHQISSATNIRAVFTAWEG